MSEYEEDVIGNDRVTVILCLKCQKSLRRWLKKISRKRFSYVLCSKRKMPEIRLRFCTRNIVFNYLV